MKRGRRKGRVDRGGVGSPPGGIEGEEEGRGSGLDASSGASEEKVVSREKNGEI